MRGFANYQGVLEVTVHQFLSSTKSRKLLTYVLVQIKGRHLTFDTEVCHVTRMLHATDFSGLDQVLRLIIVVLLLGSHGGEADLLSFCGWKHENDGLRDNILVDRLPCASKLHCVVVWRQR